MRLGRSLITMATIALAVTFLVYVLGCGAVTRGLVALARTSEDESLKLMLEHAGVDMKTGGALSARDYWLIGLSLLTCAVGVTNAMLMSVTERFREIGTMKCLGALDRFVVELFIFESSFQGLAGTAAGIVVGMLISGVYEWSRFGGYVLSGEVLARIPLVTAAALAVGLLLSVIGACYPAYVAARMAPVEALRVEE